MVCLPARRPASSGGPSHCDRVQVSGQL